MSRVLASVVERLDAALSSEDPVLDVLAQHDLADSERQAHLEQAEQALARPGK